MGWFPEQVWKGSRAYVVGGGTSLCDFPWENLRNRNVIGTNVLFYKGPDLVPVCVAGDAAFIKSPAHASGMEQYADEGGIMVTCSNSFRRKPEWLKILRRELHGLSTKALGWNGNTGAAAINLALLFGAQTVYLIGFDMQMDGDKANFHDMHPRSNPAVYPRFLKGMDRIAADLPRVFPGASIINLEDGTSKLEAFPKESLKAHFEGDVQ